METVDLKLVLLGAPRAAAAAADSRASPAGRAAVPQSRRLPPRDARAGQPGVGKTCLVYRYLYNTFGETISVRDARALRGVVGLSLTRCFRLSDHWRLVCNEKGGGCE